MSVSFFRFLREFFSDILGKNWFLTNEEIFNTKTEKVKIQNLWNLLRKFICFVNC